MSGTRRDPRQKPQEPFLQVLAVVTTSFAVMALEDRRTRICLRERNQKDRTSIYKFGNLKRKYLEIFFRIGTDMGKNPFSD